MLCQIGAALIVLALATGGAVANETNALLDRVECLGDGLLASTAMLLRQVGVEPPARSAAPVSGAETDRTEFLLQAHDQPVQRDRTRQQNRFASEAARNCLSELQAPRGS